MRLLPALALTLALAQPAAAQTVLSEASGNWAGASGDGFTFFARLTQNRDMARLTIWGGGPGSPALPEGEPQFDNPEIALGAFATRQDLEVLDQADGSILAIVTEYADEEGSGRNVTKLQFIDNQFTVVGYEHVGELAGTAFACNVDLLQMTVTEDGKTRKLAPLAFEALNASGWTWDSAYDQGFCHHHG
ncbi:hypothetical protein [Fuscovulum blasticum]|uniref:hypothetical protein n=1 Tax=Fuscovulum blasticum TaxID=1075 RepID=UPI000D3E3086|nr:hypothetical protein [Fuscovulum blasticum]AWD21247.1 hypothetical protein B6K69_05820 [Fuscovulum blasticum]